MKILSNVLLGLREIKCDMNNCKQSANYIINFCKIKRQVHIDILPKVTITKVDDLI